MMRYRKRATEDGTYTVYDGMEVVAACLTGAEADALISRLLAGVGEDRKRTPALASPQIHPNSPNLGRSTAKLFA